MNANRVVFAGVFCVALMGMGGAVSGQAKAGPGASAQEKSTAWPDQLLAVPKGGVKTLRLPGAKSAKARWKGSFTSQGNGGGRVYFMVSNGSGSQVLYEVQDSAGASFDVPLGKDGLVLTVRNAYPSDRRVVVKSREVR